VTAVIILAYRCMHVAYVNHCGGKFRGLSRCCGPLGNTLVSANIKEEEIFMAQIDVIRALVTWIAGDQTCTRVLWTVNGFPSGH
jgi:hypothetical protein